MDLEEKTPCKHCLVNMWAAQKEDTVEGGLMVGFWHKASRNHVAEDHASWLALWR